MFCYLHAMDLMDLDLVTFWRESFGDFSVIYEKDE
jgi:hypothetical protein